MRQFLSVNLVVSLLFVMTGCGQKNAASTGTPDPKANPGLANPNTGPASKAGASDESVKEYRETADSLTSEFERDYISAIKKYNGKIVELTGPFVRLRPNSWEGEPNWVLNLQGAPDRGDPGYANLNCKITDEQLDSDPRLLGLSRGQSITVRGKVQDNREVSITDCTVIKVGPSTAIPTTLQEIEAELDKNEKDFGRFKDRDVVMSVTIGAEDLTFNATSMKCSVISPKGSKKVFRFDGYRLTAEYDKRAQSLKQGDKVLFLARLDKSLAPQPWQISFSGTRILKSLPDGLKLPEEKK